MSNIDNLLNIIDILYKRKQSINTPPPICDIVETRIQTLNSINWDTTDADYTDNTIPVIYKDIDLYAIFDITLSSDEINPAATHFNFHDIIYEPYKSAIKRKYFVLIKQYHTDKIKPTGTINHICFKIVQAAYNILTTDDDHYMYYHYYRASIKGNPTKWPHDYNSFIDYCNKCTNIHIENAKNNKKI